MGVPRAAIVYAKYGSSEVKGQDSSGMGHVSNIEGQRSWPQLEGQRSDVVVRVFEKKRSKVRIHCYRTCAGHGLEGSSEVKGQE